MQLASGLPYKSRSSPPMWSLLVSLSKYIAGYNTGPPAELSHRFRGIGTTPSLNDLTSSTGNCQCGFRKRVLCFPIDRVNAFVWCHDFAQRLVKGTGGLSQCQTTQPIRSRLIQTVSEKWVRALNESAVVHPSPRRELWKCMACNGCTSCLRRKRMTGGFSAP